MKISYLKHHKLIYNPTSTLGQGIEAVPKAYFAKQSMERVRRRTAESPVFAAGKNGPEKTKPPQHDTDNPSHSYLIQTKNHRLEIIDEDAKKRN